VSNEERTDVRREEPTFRVTDKRRFAGGAEGSAEPSAPAVGAGDEQASVAARGDDPVADPTTPDGDAVDAATTPGADEAAAGDADDVATARREAAEYREHLQRLQAEFDNYRKRTIKEQSRMLERASEPVVRRILEVLDDFELALLHAEQQPDIEKFTKGVELVFAKLVDALRAEGLERIEAEGKPFDPELHEALMQTGEGEGDPVVAEVFRAGYTLKGHVLRPAGVRVERR
jgi:molecular chaperone GrpE